MVKALFPIGKTQWAKWNDMQRTAFNTLMAQGKSFPDAVTLANSMIDVFEQFEPKKHMKKSAFDVIEDVINAEPIKLEPTEKLDEVVAVISNGKKPRTPAKKGK